MNRDLNGRRGPRQFGGYLFFFHNTRSLSRSHTSHIDKAPTTPIVAKMLEFISDTSE